MTEKQVTLKIRVSTRKKLDKIKHPGQSYDGIIRELLESYENVKGGDSE
jgi:hypothetical protein